MVDTENKAQANTSLAASRGWTWVPTTERLPEVCMPVIGFADRWVDEYNEMGMRECFRNDDEWQSAAWNNYQDCWDVEVGAPDYWMPYPAAPTSIMGDKLPL